MLRELTLVSDCGILNCWEGQTRETEITVKEAMAEFQEKTDIPGPLVMEETEITETGA